jgi:ABC-type transport system substrate-binding protein
MGSTMGRGLLRAMALGAACLSLAGCLTGGPDTPPPSPATTRSTTPTASATPATTRSGPTPPRATTFSFAIASQPLDLSPARRDPAARLIDRFLFTSLYRLDDHLQPRADLATGLPFTGTDGQTWSINLRSGVRFHDGSKLTSRDVVFSYQLALSPDCPFDDLCTIAQDGMASIAADGDLGVTLSLKQADASLVATLLSQLPVLPVDLVQRSQSRFLAGAAKVGSDAVNALIETVDGDTNAAPCTGDTPPASCTLAAHVDPLEKMLRQAQLPLPSRSAFPDGAGGVDLEAYAATLLERVQLLGSTLAGSGVDQSAAALPLLDFTLHPVGSGAFRFDHFSPTDGIDLRRFDDAIGGKPAIAAVHIAIITDPRIAATALQTGEIDWLPSIGAEQIGELSNIPELRIAGRPGPGVREIVFNVRAGRLFADIAARQAFATCLDKTRSVGVATGGRTDPAWTPITPGTWAFAPDLPHPAGDPAGARRILEAAAWVAGTDGVYAKGGQRLSTALSVRASRGDQLDFANDALTQLAACGIELVVKRLDLSGGALLDQLQWPNDFDTVLVTRPLGVDPDQDLAVFDGRRITTEANQGDLNIGGWLSDQGDGLLRAARQAIDPDVRAARYADYQRLLLQDVPAYPLWYERTYGGLSARVAGAGRTIDLTAPRYDWDIDRWQLIRP